MLKPSSSQQFLKKSLSNQQIRQYGFQSEQNRKKKHWPGKYGLNQGRRFLLLGPKLLLKGPGLLLKAPGAMLRAPGQVKARFFSKTKQAQDLDYKKLSLKRRIKQKWNENPIRWSPIPISLGIALLVILNMLKTHYNFGSVEDLGKVSTADEVTVRGPWQVHVIGTLPLRSMSRLYGLVNSYTLPVWFRTPGYQLYATVFGVNTEECDPSNLHEYESMSAFFMRKLKPDARPISDSLVVSPSDGTVVSLGSVEGGRVESIKGKSYSVKALLSGIGKQLSLENGKFDDDDEPSRKVDEKEFANVNGISYSLDELIVGDRLDSKLTDASVEENELPLKNTAILAADLGTIKAWSDSHKITPGYKLFYSVIYLAPGDYHRFHSPTNWVVEKRRHFAGELFSVSPWMAKKFPGLFVVNERVALLGRWRYGLFAMVPVGATNVGSIHINFDRALRTNRAYGRSSEPGSYAEASYSNASSILKGQPLSAGDEVGVFSLGSTIVLVFEAPESFKFNVLPQDKIKMGQSLGDLLS